MNTHAYAIGITVRLTAAFTDGVSPADPSTVMLRVVTPGGERASYSWAEDEVTRTGPGSFYRDIEVTEGGYWHYRWEGTGLAEAVAEGRFYGELSRAL
jgi:hypothetical protein